MYDTPWLTIVGLGEDGLEGLPPASRLAIDQAEIVMGPPRHLELIGPVKAETIEWPVPFKEGLARLLDLRGRRTVVLASGDPFWFGAGTAIARQLARGEWRAIPGRSTFSLIASRMSWAIEDVSCFGLHAAPMARLRPSLSAGRRMIVLLRDGDAVRSLKRYLEDSGFGASTVTVFSALGGPRERVVELSADAPEDGAIAHPVAAALEVAGDGAVLPLATGRPDDWFDSDGQITKQPVRAMTLAALAPAPGERLWDIGTGSGSIAIEWLLCDRSLSATAIEADAARSKRAAANAARLGVDRLEVVTGHAPDALEGLAPPDAVFVGGGLDEALLAWLRGNLGKGKRLVANAVTLETEALVIGAQREVGGTLTRIEVSTVTDIGSRRGWKAAYPIVQWSVRL